MLGGRDYLMDMIEEGSKFLAKILFNKTSDAYNLMDEQGVVSEEGFFWHRLKKLLLQGEINHAENMLFQRIKSQPDNEEYLAVTIKFYNELAKMDDEFLESRDFSKEEIVQGLEEAKKIFTQ